MTKKKEKPEAEIDWDAEMRNAIPVIISQEIRDDVDYQTDEEVTEFYRGLTKMQRAAVDSFCDFRVRGLCSADGSIRENGRVSVIRSVEPRDAIQHRLSDLRRRDLPPANAL